MIASHSSHEAGSSTEGRLKNASPGKWTAADASETCRRGMIRGSEPSPRERRMNLPEFLVDHPDGEIRLTGHRISLYHVVYFYQRGVFAGVAGRPVPDTAVALGPQGDCILSGKPGGSGCLRRKRRGRVRTSSRLSPKAPSLEELRNRMQALKAERRSDPIPRFLLNEHGRALFSDAIRDHNARLDRRIWRAGDGLGRRCRDLGDLLNRLRAADAHRRVFGSEKWYRLGLVLSEAA